MRVQAKLISFLLFLSIVFIIGRFLYQGLENKRMYVLFENESREKSEFFDKLLKLESVNQEILVTDYTYWDDMVNFIQNKNPKFAKEMLNEDVLKTYKADAIWVYQVDCSLVYSITSKDAESITEAPFPKEAIIRGFSGDRRFVHFFVDSKAGLVEIRGATVHPSLDPQRKTPPQGYFLAGKLWKKDYLGELAGLIGGNIRLSPKEEDIPSPEELSHANSILFSKKLMSWNGEPLSYIYINMQSRELETYKAFSRNAIILSIIFLALILVIIASSLAAVVNYPLGVISNVLRKDNPDELHKLDRDNSEFGDIARLIYRFFEQKQELVKEVEERKKAEADLESAYKELRELQDQLIQSAKLNAVGQLASGVAHEVRNPLGIILQGVNYLEKSDALKESKDAEVLSMVKDSVKRADKIIRTLLDFSKSAKLDLRPEDINVILDSSLGLLKASIKFENIAIITELSSNLPTVFVDRNKIEQVVINVLLNAIQAMPGGGKIVIRSFIKELDEKRDGIGMRPQDKFRLGEEAVVIEIEDTGPGIPDNVKTKIFDPFFTTKGPTGGSGLGLSVSRNILELHKGLIYVETELGMGTKIVIIFKTLNNMGGTHG